jgi:hypothetical protein
MCKEGSPEEMLHGGVVHHEAAASSSKPRPVPHIVGFANGYLYEPKISDGTAFSIVCSDASDGGTLYKY